MKLLLDILWWDDDYDRLLDILLNTLTDPSTTTDLSLASIWEMQIKIQLGKLNFTIPLPEKIHNQRADNGLRNLAFGGAINALGDCMDWMQWTMHQDKHS